MIEFYSMVVAWASFVAAIMAALIWPHQLAIAGALVFASGILITIHLLAGWYNRSHPTWREP
jgi:hypothetical protein